MYTTKQISSLRHITNDNLVDIKTIKIDDSQPIGHKLDSYLKQIKNPYVFLCGKTKVTIEYNTGGKSLDELLTNYLSRQSHHCEA